MTEPEVAALSAALTGDVLAPSDAGYDDARALWNRRFDRRPALIARCRSADDVRHAVHFARAHALELSVKGGGHAFAANTVGDGGLLVDLSLMKGMSVDAGARTLRVEPGVKWGELDPVTQARGLATVGGTVSSVGVAGFVLGGGSGNLTRKYGMAVDNLLAAEVVTADGRIVRASAIEHPDLFWALRGGGGNFGIVTAFDLRLHQVGPEVLAGQIMHPLSEAASLLQLYREFMRTADDDVQCFAFFFRVPPIPVFPEAFHGQVVLDLIVFHPDAGAEATFAPLLGFGHPILSYVSRQPYVDAQRAFDAGVPGGQRWDSRAQDLADLSDEVIDVVLSRIGELPGEFTSAYFAPGGGATARVDASATAFPHRHAAFSFHIMAGWSGPADDERVTAWAQDVCDALEPHSTGGVYVNVLGAGEQSRIRAAYGDNFDRLVEVKRKWDPENLFRMNHNIRP